MIYKKDDMVTAKESNERKGITKGKDYKVINSDISGVKIINDDMIPYRIGYELFHPWHQLGNGNNRIVVVYNTADPVVVAIIHDEYRNTEHVIIRGIAFKVENSISMTSGRILIQVIESNDNVQKLTKMFEGV